MAFIRKQITLSTNPKKVVLIRLKSNKSIDPLITFPITWEGTINNKEVEIVQDEDATETNDYIFNKLPIEYIDFKEEIVEEIDTSLKQID